VRTPVFLNALCIGLLTVNCKLTTKDYLAANNAATDPYCTAVALTERSAVFVSFQRHQPGFPPTQNVNSAPRSRTSAVQFSGINANSATNAAIAAFCVSNFMHYWR
jgi:hypothetical protein